MNITFIMGMKTEIKKQYDIITSFLGFDGFRGTLDGETIANMGIVLYNSVSASCLVCTDDVYSSYAN